MELRKRFLCNRLGRDEILSHLKNETPSANFKFKYLDKENLISELINKVVEEAEEVFEEQNNDENLKKEICDVLEVLDCLRQNLGFSKEDILKAKEAKIKKRGSFKKGLFIYWIEIFKRPTERIYEYVMSQPEKYPAENIKDCDYISSSPNKYLPENTHDKEKVRFWYSKQGKLVRDDSILRLQEECPEANFNYKYLNKKEFLSALFDKLKEEAAEVLEEKNNKDELKNEIADVTEIIETICSLKGFSPEEIKIIGDKKNETFGSFKTGLFVEWIELPKGSRMYEYAILQPEKYKVIESY